MNQGGCVARRLEAFEDVAVLAGIWNCEETLLSWRVQAVVQEVRFELIYRASVHPGSHDLRRGKCYSGDSNNLGRAMSAV